MAATCLALGTATATAVRAPDKPWSGYVAALDGVRGLAICGVLLIHSYGFITDTLPPALADPIKRAGDLGRFGVDLFFVLSGFLITGILVDTRSSRHYFRNFYARRFLRLFPVYYGYIFFLAFLLPKVHLLLRTTMPDYHGNWWWYLLYFCNWIPDHGVHNAYLGHFWSLAVEEQFYILWPAMVFFLPRRILAWTCFGIAVAAFMLRMVCAGQNVQWQTIYCVTITRLDSLAIGALAGLAVRSPKWRALAFSYAVPITVLGLSAFGALGVVAGGFSWDRKLIQTVGATAAAVGFGGLVLQAALLRTGWLAQCLIHPLLTNFGKYSYGIYVYHFAVREHCAWIFAWIAQRVSPQLALPIGILAFFVSNILAFFVARLSYIHFEQRVLRYKDRFQ